MILWWSFLERLHLFLLKYVWPFFRKQIKVCRYLWSRSMKDIDIILILNIKCFPIKFSSMCQFFWYQFNSQVFANLSDLNYYPPQDIFSIWQASSGLGKVCKINISIVIIWSSCNLSINIMKIMFNGLVSVLIFIQST